jgi:hypothetical protein
VKVAKPKPKNQEPSKCDNGEEEPSTSSDAENKIVVRRRVSGRLTGKVNTIVILLIGYFFIDFFYVRNSNFPITMMMMVEILTQTLTVMVQMNRNQIILTKKNILLARRGVSSVVVGVAVNVQRVLQGQKLSFLRIVKTFTVLFPASR